MAGTSQLRCEGFIEGEGFAQSKDALKARYGLTDQQIDDRLEGLLWALRRDASAVSERVSSLNLWVAVIERGIPPLRIYLRPRPDVPAECELMWIEERFD
jgi:hypothetical protein